MNSGTDPSEKGPNLLTLGKLALRGAGNVSTVRTGESATKYHRAVCETETWRVIGSEYVEDIFGLIFFFLPSAAFFSAYADIALSNLMGTVSTHTGLSQPFSHF